MMRHLILSLIFSLISLNFSTSKNIHTNLASKSILSNLETLFIPKAFAEYRIVSYNPSLTEILFELGLGQHVVGVTSFSDYPEAAKKITTVGNYFKPNIEKTISLKPTHVLVASEGQKEILEFLEKSKLNYFVLPSRNLKDYETSVLKIGKLFGKEQESIQLKNKWISDFEKLKSNHSKTLLIQLEQNPIMAAGKDTFLSEGLSFCGFKNIFNFSGYQRVSLEKVLKLKPSFILVLSEMTNSSYESIQNFWKSTPLNAQLLKAQNSALSRLGPRLPSALEAICKESKAQ